MTINQLECFVAAATHHSFSHAARKLYISQPNLSKSIESLEKELGVTLFSRTNKGVTLTSDGAYLLNQATDILARINGVKEYYTSRKEQGASLRISSQPIYPVAQALASLQGKGVKVVLQETNRSHIIEDVANNRSEIGVIMTSTADPLRFGDVFVENHLKFCLVAEDDARVYINKNHPLSHNSCITHKQLRDYPQIVFNLDSFTENNIENYGTNVTITNSTGYVKQLLKTSDSFMVQTPWDSGIFADGDIVAIPFKDQAIKVQIGYCIMNNRILSPQAQDFLETIKNIIDEKLSDK